MDRNKMFNNPEINMLFKKYNIFYNREKQIIKVKNAITVKEFTLLKSILKLFNFEVCDIIVGEDTFAKI